MDKKGQAKDWMNLFTITVNEYPVSVIPASFGPNAISSATYKLTSIDNTTKVS